MLVASCHGTTDIYHAWHMLEDNTEEIPALAMEADMVDTRTYSDAMVKAAKETWPSAVAQGRCKLAI